MWSQSGSPNSQNEPPNVYMPAAAMLTEQKPPWAAKLGVPNWLAHQPVSDWDWSRPVKKASFFRIGLRMSPSHSVGKRQGLVPFDFTELAGAALADAQQRRSGGPASSAA